MSWPGSIFIAFITAIVGCFASGWAASLGVRWHRVSSFEGQSAYAVLAFALLGIVGGFFIGLIVTRLVAAGSNPTFFKGFWISHAVLLGIIGVLTGFSRLAADIPPRIGGQELLLAVEVRWPEGETPPSTASTESPVMLAVMGPRGSIRKSSSGMMWLEDARLEEGRWIVPAAVDLFTSRGKRTLLLDLGGGALHGFILPLRGNPGKRDLEWSEWLPRRRSGRADEFAPGFSYRYRVLPVNQPVRSESFGDFEIDTIASSFYQYRQDGVEGIAAFASFAIRHRGAAITVPSSEPGYPDETIDRFDSVQLFSASHQALLVDYERKDRRRGCAILASIDGRLEVRPVPGCTAIETGWLLAPDPAAAERMRAARIPPGSFNRRTFARDGLFLIQEAVVDSRTLSSRFLEVKEEKSNWSAEVPPLLFSPDERSFVRAGTLIGEAEYVPILEVIEIDGGESYLVPIDLEQTRFFGIEALDQEWASHYFEWVRDNAGHDRLVVRQDVTPLPYRGRLSIGSDRKAIYELRPAGRRLFDAFVEFLRTELGARQTAANESAYGFETTVRGTVVNISHGNGRLSVGTYYAPGNDVMIEIATRFNQALATGRYDELFESDPPPEAIDYSEEMNEQTTG